MIENHNFKPPAVYINLGCDYLPFVPSLNSRTSPPTWISSLEQASRKIPSGWTENSTAIIERAAEAVKPENILGYAEDTKRGGEEGKGILRDRKVFGYERDDKR